ncbi:MAG: type II toxin-antitoxin system VapB family antitoxin [Kineosporiaceae bacterium]|nr:type II toxin-antitoxin system VapB family antitoxin [Kineosporiaceae bacterium]MBK7623112.1 type II toxin-antitoxin system VapB family antitoxin [Kineosporiaceae bacterium]MBK8074937.1 type II toxin-antitoxin system VapB family antitoxin [Kineosporiaceae bacterium]
MRTTVAIEDGLLDQVKLIAAQRRGTVSSVVEEALRELLARHQAQQVRADVVLPVSGSGGLAPGVDLHDREHVADLLGENRLR